MGLARMAAMFANGGVTCHSNERMFDFEAVKCVLSFMLMNGVFQFSGEWAFNIGLPAKSGISGNLFITIPGLGGLAMYCPSFLSSFQLYPHLHLRFIGSHCLTNQRFYLLLVVCRPTDDLHQVFRFIC